MLYELKKNAQGKYVLLIYNTGGGVDEHIARSTAKGLYYSSVKAFEFPMTDLLSHESSLRNLLQTLIVPQLARYFKDEIGIPENYNGKSLYKQIRDAGINWAW